MMLIQLLHFNNQEVKKIMRIWRVEIHYLEIYDKCHDVLFTDDPIGFLHTIDDRYDDYVQENITKFKWREIDAK